MQVSEHSECYTGAVTGWTALVPVNGHSTIRFSVFELDLKAGELRRNGSKIRLQEQPFQILVSLLEHPGEVVTREELRCKLWPADTFVDFDHSLNAAIRRLRDALGDSADGPRFVETVARRGYRFIAPVIHPRAGVESTAAVRHSDQESAAPAVRETVPRSVISEHRGHKWRSGIAIAALLIAGALAGLHFVRSSAVRPRVSQRRLTANRPELPVLNATLSPSGKYLAFADPTGVYLRQVDSGETHPIPLPSGFVANPLSWFPDDNHLLVTTHPSTSTPPSLWRVSVMGGQPQLLTDNGSSAVASFDGSQIAFVRGFVRGSQSSQEIWIMQADGEKTARLLGCNGCFLGGLVWSPDGKQVAYVKQQYQMGSFWGFDTELEILNLASNRIQVLESHVGPALAWTPEGRIIYVAGEPPPNQGDSNLWAVRVNAHTMRPEGTPERITNGNGLIAGVSASADGRRLAILRRTLQPNVYVAQLQNHGTRLSTPRLLTPDEWYDFPTAWTADSKSVLFFSDRDGVFHIFKQAIDQTQPQLLVGGDEAVALPRLNPDGSIVLYVNSRYDVALQSPHPDVPLGTQQVMRVPVTGGPPQLVLEGRGINNLQCARLPSTLCIYSELAPGEEHFYTFDPLKGKGNEIPGATIHESDFSSFNWSLSPDGKLLAFSKKFGTQGQPAIRLFSLVDAKERRISLPGWAGIATLDWSADGESLWSTAFTTSETTSGLWTTGFNATGEWTLLKVELTGKVTPMLRESKMNLGWAIPSPDGGKLAIWKANGSSNVWLAESQ